MYNSDIFDSCIWQDELLLKILLILLISKIIVFIVNDYIYEYLKEPRKWDILKGFFKIKTFNLNVYYIYLIYLPVYIIFIYIIFFYNLGRLFSRLITEYYKKSKGK